MGFSIVTATTEDAPTIARLVKALTVEIMSSRQVWFRSIADSQVAQGGFMGGRETSKKSTRDLPWDRDSLTGYHIIEAESLGDAEKSARNNPFMTSIRIYEFR